MTPLIIVSGVLAPAFHSQESAGSAVARPTTSSATQPLSLALFPLEARAGRGAARTRLRLLLAGMPLSHSGRSASVGRVPRPTFDNGGGHEGPRFVQTRPSDHAEQQYSGFFRGLGTTSKEPICSKRNTVTKRIHDATHFAIGCRQWEDPRAGESLAQATFTDPQVVYATCDAPDKNASVVELRQIDVHPDVHYRTEQRERFTDRGLRPRDAPFPHRSSVHLGDDRPELMTHTSETHCEKHEGPEARRAASFRSAGQGTLIPTSSYIKPVRCNPVHAGPRTIDLFDLGVERGVNFGRISANRSNIIYEATNRNPILGHHVPHSALVPDESFRSTAKLVDTANCEVPPLRSLGAVRPHVPRDNLRGGLA